MFNKHEISRDACQLFGRQAKCGYDWWWHSFTGHHAVTGEEKTFFVEFFLCNPKAAQCVPSFGQLGDTPSYLMVKAGAWGEDAAQLHRFFSWNQAKVSMTVPYSVEAGNCFVNENETQGVISVSREEAQAHPEWMCQSGRMEWKLKIDKKIAFNVGYGAGKLMRKLQLFEMFWHAEGMKTLYSGEVIWNGERYLVTPDTCFGYADKNWGTDFTSPWVWLSSNDLTSTVSGKNCPTVCLISAADAPKSVLLS